MENPSMILFLISSLIMASSTMASHNYNLPIEKPDPAHQNSPQDFVDAHNSARAQVGVRPLAWNDTVAAYASEYAQKRYGDCELQHSDGPYGENLAEGWGRLSAVDAVGMWVSEKSSYDYNSNSCVGGECLHFTQVVWSDSTQLGCARIQCRNGWLFVICNYYPPGNYIGQRPY